MIKFTRFSMKNTTAIIILMLLLFVGGSYASTTLKVESMPDISFPVVLVSTTYTAPPKDVLEEVTKPLEKSVANLQGLKNLTSTSNDNYSQIIVELTQGVDLDKAKQDVESLVATAALPDSAEKPRVLTFGFASQPVYYLAVYGEQGMNQIELDKLYENTILPGLQSIKGVDHIDSIGNQKQEVKIKLDANALLHYGLTPSQVSNAIRANLVSSPAGSIVVNGNTDMVRVTGQFDTIYNLEHMLITTNQGATLKLNQISKVEAISESPFVARLDGKSAIGINLYKTKDANAVEFGNATDRLIAGWEKTMPNVTFQKVFNSAEMIQESVDGMVREGGLGAILASIMILLFLRNLRMTLIVLVSIPLSLVITLMLMAPLGITINIMTLGGMAIAVGRVVDDSIVVIENIYRQLLRAQERNESVIIMATKQVASAITSSTLTTVGVFAPIAFVSGVVGEVFRPFALTIACALLSSLLVALTVIPVLTKLMVMRSRSIPEHGDHKESRLTMAYKHILEWSLKHRFKTITIAFLAFVLSFVIIVPNLATSFMPDSEADKQMLFQIKMPRETSMDLMDAQSKQIETYLRESKDANQQPLFTYVESLVGYNFGDTRVPYRSTLFTEVNRNADASAVLKQYQQRLLDLLPDGSEVTGQLLSFTGGGEAGGDFTYSLKGDDLLLLQQAAAMIEQHMKQFPELTDIKDSLGESKMEVEVAVNQEKAQLYGLTAAQIVGNVHQWVSDDKIGDLKFNNIMYATKVGLDDSFKDSIEDLSGMPIQTPLGTTIQLRDVATVDRIDAPVSITREKQQQVVNVTATIDHKDKGGVSNKVSKALDAIDLPPGISREVAGVTEDIGDSFIQMFVAMGASIFIVFLVMLLAFGNASAPLAILFSLPLAAIGGLLGLWITGESLNVTSLIGFLMLIGIVVTNAIVLIDLVQQLREQGQPIREALMEAGLTRLRPIIMTAGATIFALVPLAIGLSKGTLISKGLAVVVIGGLTTSTLLTLVVVPIMYELIYAFWARMARKFGRKSQFPVASSMADPILK